MKDQTEYVYMTQTIERYINNIKVLNQEAGEKLLEQLRKAKSHNFDMTELSEQLKSDEDVADKYYKMETQEHQEIREVQDMIIAFYGR